MRVLFAMPFLPLPEGGAASRCAVALLRGLRELGVDCEVLASVPADVDPGTPPDDLAVEAVRVRIPGRLGGRWNRWVRPAARLSRGPYAERLVERAPAFDIVHFVGLHTSSALKHVERPALVQLDCVTRRDRQIKTFWRGEDQISIELMRAERRVMRQARWLLASSEEVAADFAAASHRAEVVAAPLPLDPALYEPRAPLDAPLAGVIGIARWPPTANAVERLVTRVWPRVLERRPDARVALAGVGMEPEAFPALANAPGVEWRGRVPSAADFIRELGLMLYPLGAGSGTKVKVLEAMALGVPVVTTREGAEGLVSRDGVMVEEDDARLADAALSLIDDAEARRAAGRQAYENFTRHHTPAVAARPVAQLYERMLA